MPSAEDIARVVLNSPVNPQAPEAEQVSVRTALRRVLTAPEPVSEATIRSIASQAARQAVADLLATLPDNIDMENACARALAAQVTVEQETLSRTEVQKAVAIAMREVLGSLDETETP